MHGVTIALSSVAPQVAWSLQPLVLLGVAALAWGYAWAWRRARRPGAPHPPGLGRAVLFAGGLLAVLAALISPLDSLGDQLMVFHMVQHMLLLDIAPILLTLGLTKGLLRPVTRRVHALERRAGPLAHPAFAVIAYAGLLWLWHIPFMYDQAQGNSGLHVLEHLCFAAAGSLYWWHLLSPIRSRMRLGGLGPIGYMVATKLLVGLLGVALAFAPDSIYPFYTHKPAYWGLSAHFDQSMAGLVMALEQSIVMGIALVYLFVRMLSESEREAERADRYGLA
jgi:putative membrane protein